MLILRNAFLLLLFFVLLNCGGEEKVKSNVPVKEKELVVKQDSVQQINISDILLTELAMFPEQVNADSELMDTLFLPTHQNLNDGFALFCKFKAGNKTFIFDRNIEGKLMQINAFNAAFVFKDTMSVDYPDIMLRFKEDYSLKETYYYNCWFSYDIKLSRYTFDNCFSINLEDKSKDYQRDVYNSETASSEIKDETDNDVLRILEDNGYLN
jgi:hypothetical protein